MEPWGVYNSIQVDVGPGWEAILIRIWRQDVKDSQQDANQPATTHAKQSLDIVIKNKQKKIQFNQPRTSESEIPFSNPSRCQDALLKSINQSPCPSYFRWWWQLILVSIVTLLIIFVDVPLHMP